MEQYKTNQFKINQIKTKNNKFKLIENNFIFNPDNSPKTKKKSNSHPNSKKRPNLQKQNKNIKNKILADKPNQLDQIGNDDLIFNNDKLITSIKLENMDELNFEEENNNSNENDNSGSAKGQRTKRMSLTPFRDGRNNRYQKVSSPKSHKKSNNINNSDISHSKNGKISNLKSLRNKNILQSNRVKIINQFINKPNESNNKNNDNYTKKNIQMTPMPKKNISKISYNNSFNKISNIRFNKTIDNQSETISISSISKIGGHKSSRGKSMPNQSNLKSNMHFPNKSIAKNKDKLLNDLQKFFGDKLQLNDDVYQNMTDIDKKNCINFLLESLKELFNNKGNQSKNQGYKELAEKKDKELKEAKSEIKELKKETTKLNKIIKANIQMNRKLSQNIDKLKSQLEKEKEKNRNREFKTKGKSLNRSTPNFNIVKHRNESNDLSMTTSRKTRRNMSQDKFRNTNEFINKKKNNKKKVKNRDDSINKLDNNNNNNKEKIISNCINNIKIEDNKNNFNYNKQITKDCEEQITPENYLIDDINLVENIIENDEKKNTENNNITPNNNEVNNKASE